MIVGNLRGHEFPWWRGLDSQAVAVGGRFGGSILGLAGVRRLFWQFLIARLAGGRRHRQVEVVRHVKDHLPIDWLPAERASGQQGVVADHVDRTWQSAGQLMNQEHRFSAEQRRGVATCRANSHRHVCSRFVDAERPYLAANGDALLQLSEAGIVQPISQLGLTRQHDW